MTRATERAGRVILLDALRTVAEHWPQGTPMSIPAPWLRELLPAESDQAVPILGMTVQEAATHYHRHPSTVRGWCQARRFPNAYRLNQREWRIPQADLAEFEADQQQRRHQGSQPSAGVRTQLRKPLGSVPDLRAVLEEDGNGGGG